MPSLIRLAPIILLTTAICLAAGPAAAELPYLVADLFPGGRADIGLGPRHITPSGGSVFFAGRRLDLGTELWAADPPTGEVRLVLDLNPGWGDGDPGALVDLGGTLLFQGDDGVHGWELWLTDGSPGGTAMAFDLMPGPAGSRFPYLEPEAVVAAGRLVYPADVPGLGRELVVTDGTPAGTDVLDVVPGPSSSDPWFPVHAGNRIFVSAIDLVHGRELWALDAPLFLDGFESGSVSAWSWSTPR